MKAKRLTYILLFVLFASIGRSGVWTSGLTIINHSTSNLFTTPVWVYRVAYNQDQTWGGGAVDMLYASDAVSPNSTKVYGPYYSTTGTLIPGAPGYYAEVWYKMGSQPAVKYGTYPYCCDNVLDVDTTIILNVDGNNEYVPVCTTNLYWHSLNTTAYWRLYSVVNVATSAAENSQLIGPNSYYTYSKTVPCSQANDYELYASGGNGDDNVQPTGDKGITNGVPTGDPGTNNVNGGGSVTNSAPPTLQPTNSTLPAVTNADHAILWSNTNNDVSGVTSATKDSGQALFNAANQAAAQNHSDLAGINDSINAVRNQAHADATNANNGQNAMAQQAHQDSQSAQNLASTGVTMAHNDANDLKQLIAGLTNSGFGGLTNYALETTQKSVDESLFTVKGTIVGISNLLSGFFGAGSDTNSASEVTNLNLSSLSGSFSNLIGTVDSHLDSMNTNFGVGDGTNGMSYEIVGATNAAQADEMAISASPELEVVRSRFQQFVDEATGFTIDEDFGDPDMTYTFDIGGAYAHSLSKSFGLKSVVTSDGLTIDFNPLHNERVSVLFQYCKRIIAWGIALFYMRACAIASFDALYLAAVAQGANAGGAAVKVKK